MKTMTPPRWLFALALLALGAACASTGPREGLDASQLPPDVRDDYALFARRCSKCHSLARPLNSGIDDDARWTDYVTRMRRQPGSGITQQDTGPILRFLHYYSLEQQRAKRARAMANQRAAASQPPPPAEAAPERTADR